ncbi:hypothetical protein RUM44_001295 [Polyplax serrata]|uniref:Uncharacterized protein n=1 Tax=Polyplax serrata TaxID=468196 RepID=A0ABR1AJN4_POLSC
MAEERRAANAIVRKVSLNLTRDLQVQIRLGSVPATRPPSSLLRDIYVLSPRVMIATVRHAKRPEEDDSEAGSRTKSGVNLQGLKEGSEEQGAGCDDDS